MMDVPTMTDADERTNDKRYRVPLSSQADTKCCETRTGSASERADDERTDDSNERTDDGDERTDDKRYDSSELKIYLRQILRDKNRECL
jgi:hypothetical protein